MQIFIILLLADAADSEIPARMNASTSSVNTSLRWKFQEARPRIPDTVLCTEIIVDIEQFP